MWRWLSITQSEKTSTPLKAAMSRIHEMIRDLISPSMNSIAPWATRAVTW